MTRRLIVAAIAALVLVGHSCTDGTSGARHHHHDHVRFPGPDGWNCGLYGPIGDYHGVVVNRSEFLCRQAMTSNDWPLVAHYVDGLTPVYGAP